MLKFRLKNFIKYVCDDPGIAYFRIEHPAYGFIGHASLSTINLDDMSFSAGYVIGEKKYWGEGIGTNVEKMVLNRTKELDFKTAKASAHKDNIASISILTKQFGGV